MKAQSSAAAAVWCGTAYYAVREDIYQRPLLFLVVVYFALRFFFDTEESKEAYLDAVSPEIVAASAALLETNHNADADADSSAAGGNKLLLLFAFLASLFARDRQNSGGYATAKYMDRGGQACLALAAAAVLDRKFLR